jgi:hypothetical protein
MWIMSLSLSWYFFFYYIILYEEGLFGRFCFLGDDVDNEPEFELVLFFIISRTFDYTAFNPKP